MENRFYNAFDEELLDPSQGVREGEYRTVFEINRDRIIHTSAFRRLQSKTQVFLSGEYDFYRTRLTHSIEVSQIGRSICAKLRRTSDLLGADYFIDPDLVEAACLAHDLGHPPFGHAGERTLHRLMRGYGGFEGNAQTLRMLTETIFSRQHSGMNPCRAFLDSTLKYKSLYSELSRPEHHFLYDPQHRWLDWVLGGRDFPLELPPGPARDGFRSIECQIMDWADDTAYSLNDIADGINAGFLTLETLERWGASQELSGDEADHLVRLLRSMREQRAEVRLRSRIGRFIDAASLELDVNFMSPHTNRYRYRLAVLEEARREAKFYKRMALHLVFRSRQLQQLEAKCDRMLTMLFGALSDRYVTETAESPFRLLSEGEEAALAAASGDWERARLVCDVLSRMTDGAATRTWRRLFDADFRSLVDFS
jgi:dGTPase